MEIATLNEILFPPFLFLVIFSFLCCQFHSLTRTVKNPAVSTATPQIETTTLQSQQLPLHDELIADQEPEAEGQEQAKARELVTTDPSLIAELEATIDLNKLSLRACRAIAGKLSELDKERLGISQKVNGSDKPASQLVAEVKNRFKKDPATVAPVILQHANPSALIRQDEEQQLTEPQAQAS
ncbi:MAG TPA: hypothetical protein V6C95_24030 [Coleofasciculaceae cyanobacterium]